jgi:membrane protein YqaA with SNARE-associated domain
MGNFVANVRALALSLGAPGLFLVAFLDSSFLSLPEIADFLVVWMVTRHKARMILYVVSATIGSMAGSLVMYYIGRKGGEALVARRFATASIERTKLVLQRHGIMAVLIPSILPPPAPFKIFVLLAGVAGISARRFLIAIAIGRGVRYLALGLLAVEYGDRAMAYLAENSVRASILLGIVLLVGFVAYLAWSKAQAAKRR